MSETTFLLGIHNHQPIGNFPEVFEMGYQKAYRPFLEIMEKHPGIKWSLHLSGILWDYMRQKHPEYIASVKKMADAGRVEILSGGYYEPILAVIPDRDKLGQIKKLNEFIKNTFGQTPKGIWLTERIWEPTLPKVLNDAGIEYTLVDDYHFLAAGQEPETLRGYYVTEDAGCKLDIFPISQKLRYYIPFEDVHKSIDLFRDNIKYNSSLTMGDDGEKFGMWPKTHEHVYGKNGAWQHGWLNRFLSAIGENSSWLKTTTFSEYLKSHSPSGRIYLPTTSYYEMSEWTLPASRQHEMETAIERVERMQDGHLVKTFLRGGFWRNFLTKYIESNNMHKKMLYVSERLNDAISKMQNAGKTKTKKRTLPAQYSKDEIQNAINHLYAAQCNCAYWHGVFGGLYLPHLRKAVYEELIKSEKPLAPSTPVISKLDINKDGRDEILYESKTQNLYLTPAFGGAVYEWDIIDPPVNVTNVLTRRYEAYHNKIRGHVENVSHGHDAPKTIHGMVKMKEKNLDNYLHYDWYTRGSLIDHFLHPSTTIDDFAKCKYVEQGDFVIEPYEPKIDGETIKLSRRGALWINGIAHDLIVEKKIRPGKSVGFGATYTIKNLSGSGLEILFGVEFNLAFFAGFQKTSLSEAGEWEFLDKVSGLKFVLKTSPSSAVWTFPIETVSLSEDGFERTLQGGCVVRLWRFNLPAGESRKMSVDSIWLKA